MCGLAGWVDHAGLGPDAQAVAEKMNDQLTHRGPDGSGVWLARRAVLAHRRLSVIDIEGGAQPMTLAEPGRTEPRWVVTYNGELYNHRELRRELTARGHRFRTASDTEVLLAAWAEWGADAARRLNGIFAFAVWDDREETLWLVRDHLGVKPLLYHHDGGRLIFGSEAKAILAHPDVATEVDEDGLRQLALPLLKFPGTNPYRGVAEVLPGQVLSFTGNGVRTHRYWDLAELVAAPAATEDPDEAAERLRSLLHDTVTRQTIADVPLCTLLSGGLDSSVVTAIAAGLPERAGLGSFSVDFTDAAGSADSRSAQDRHHAREAAAFIGTRHANIVLDSHLLSDSAERDATVRARDLPNGFGDLDTSLLLLCREIRRHATVALSGEAADEILGGYLWFSEPRAVAADTFPWMADSPAHGYLHQRVLGTLDPELVERLRLEEYLADAYATALGGLDLDPALAPRERRHREIVYLALTHFLTMLLDRNDRLSMASGLEVRVPFTDHRVVELLVTLPRAVHHAGGREKGVLRDAAVGLLPESVRERRKSPYPTSPDPDYSRRLTDHLTRVLHDPPEGLDAIFAAPALDPRHIGEAARSHGLVSNFEGEVILNFASWLRQYTPRLAL
ncbi:asparagine synthase (glutamine-hydrolyzing) [Streptomyces sp. 3MP-14]|uniref:asparagine synthase (glutamine-hydrolyzing) n=1 Tax=Streptomyces mimosae TaxID=2586635 RepID=A0A5N6A270_9ACTN|nr:MULTISPECIES: asparagine synthase (glutamine-hydrolyzing) [Streptomyces]KAB8162867.1 asparagine synthase (glutamine-hydrolyzing) [Streptomyces mimosae]KAB8179080.1 asparagine synthase (glutamine-hydrolyzing) [Streptomyces sp. 3MP-14]